MLNNHFINFVTGCLASLVPITILSTKYLTPDGSCSKNGIIYPKIVQQIIPLLIVLNMVMMPFLYYLKITNFIVIGVVMALIISGIGRFYSEIPTKVLDMKNPNHFHFYAILIWGLFYGIVISYLHQICHI